jgi:hypothetical protein
VWRFCPSAPAGSSSSPSLRSPWASLGFALYGDWPGQRDEPSLAIVRKLGFVRAGEQWGEEDGLEHVFELALARIRR